jgi:hypothetical protein
MFLAGDHRSFGSTVDKENRTLESFISERPHKLCKMFFQSPAPVVVEHRHQQGRQIISPAFHSG